MTKGQVKWFDPKKGYGFIIGPESQDVFVHYSQIQSEGFRALKDGEMVEYELVQGDKGWQARDVRQADRGEAAPASKPPSDDRPAPGGGYESAPGASSGYESGTSASSGYEGADED